jgi:hypothetical protein
MRFKSIHVKNFRALETIDVDLETRVNVIVGPNAIGKTTILEAIRLAKAIVAPRSPNEATQALIALGAVAPYDPQRVVPAALARDPGLTVEIRCRYQLELSEIDSLMSGLAEIVTNLALNSSGQNLQNANFNIAFLSSPQGKAVLGLFESQVKEALDRVRNGTQNLFLDLQFDPISGPI